MNGTLATLLVVGMEVFEAQPEEADYNPRGGHIVSVERWTGANTETGEILDVHRVHVVGHRAGGHAGQVDPEGFVWHTLDVAALSEMVEPLNRSKIAAMIRRLCAAVGKGKSSFKPDHVRYVNTAATLVTAL